MKSYLLKIATLFFVTTGINASVDAQNNFNHDLSYSQLKLSESLSTELAQNSETLPESTEVVVKHSRQDQLTQAYGYVLGQQATLDLIEKKFPDLAFDVQKARFAFKSTALGKGFEGVKQELSLKLGEKWTELEELIISKTSSIMDRQEITRQKSVAFLHEVHQRAKGKVPQSILATLLSVHPQFSKNPGLEISSGWKQTFRTKGHSKAKGVDFSLSFPASWSKRESNRPNIIQVFRSSAGHGSIMCVLMVKTLPFPTGYKPTREELEEFFQPNELKNYFLDGGSTFVEAETTVLEGLPAGIIVSDHNAKRLGQEITMRMTKFLTIYNSSMIFIQFSVAKTPNSTDTLDDLQKQFLPNFKIIANTFVLNDLYR